MEAVLLKAIYGLILIAVVMGLAAYSVLLERKVSSWIQGRIGPNRTSLPLIAKIPLIGPFLRYNGIWQPLADGLKFLLKEDPIPGHVKKRLLYLSSHTCSCAGAFNNGSGAIW